MSTKDNPIRKVWDRPMERPVEGAKEKFGRCVVEKSPRSASIDTRNVFTIIAEQMAYILGTFLPNIKSKLAWFSSPPVHQSNMIFYHVFEEDDYVSKV